MTNHIKRFPDNELLACLRLISKIFSHIQSPVTHIVSSNSTSPVVQAVTDHLGTTNKPTVNGSDVKVKVESVADDR